MNSRWVGRTAMVVVSCLVVMAGLASGVKAAHAPPLNRLDLRVLLIGQPGGDPTTQAWQAQLSSEGVPYTLAAAQGTPGSQTVALPNLTDPSDSTHGLFNGVVIASSVYNFAWGQLSDVWGYESTFGVRQLDGYVYPAPNVGLDPGSGGDLSGTTAVLTAAGQSAF